MRFWQGIADLNQRQKITEKHHHPINFKKFLEFAVRYWFADLAGFFRRLTRYCSLPPQGPQRCSAMVCGFDFSQSAHTTRFAGWPASFLY